MLTEHVFLLSLFVNFVSFLCLDSFTVFLHIFFGIIFLFHIIWWLVSVGSWLGDSRINEYFNILQNEPPVLKL